MEHEISDSLRQLLSAQTRLVELGVISSRDYLGDIGRFLCRQNYGLELPRGSPDDGLDGTIGGLRVAVSLNDCPAGTPVCVNEPLNFDELIVVLGPHCVLRPEGVASDFIFYRFTPTEVREKFKESGDGYVGGEGIFDRGYDRVLNLRAG